jgi:hypothetical protein
MSWLSAKVTLRSICSTASLGCRYARRCEVYYRPALALLSPPGNCDDILSLVGLGERLSPKRWRRGITGSEGLRPTS